MKHTTLSITFVTAAMAAFMSTQANGASPSIAGPNDVSLQVEDANGNVLGRAWWLGDKWAAVMQGATQVFAVTLSNVDDDLTHLDFDRQGTLYYKTTDCSGQAYVSTSYLPRSVRTAVALHSDGRFLLLIAGGVRETSVLANSERRGPRVCVTKSSQLEALPIVETLDISGTFQSPFSIR